MPFSNFHSHFFFINPGNRNIKYYDTTSNKFCHEKRTISFSRKNIILSENLIKKGKPLFFSFPNSLSIDFEYNIPELVCLYILRSMCHKILYIRLFCNKYHKIYILVIYFTSSPQSLPVQRVSTLGVFSISTDLSLFTQSFIRVSSPNILNFHKKQSL